MKILGTLALLWLISFAKANEDQSDSFEEAKTEESSELQTSSLTSSSSQSSTIQKQYSIVNQQESYSEQKSLLYQQQSSFQKDKFLSHQHQSSFQEQIDKKTSNYEKTNQQFGRPETVWIGETPDSRVYDIVEVESNQQDSKTSSQTVTSKHETDDNKKVVKEKKTLQPQPESIWIGNTPDSRVYDIVEIESQKEDSRTSSQIVISNHETDNKKKVVNEKNTRQSSRPESVWVGNKPDSSEYDIVEVESKKRDSRTTSQTVTSKHETGNKMNVVKVKNSRQPSRPESVWIGNKPDSSEYDIVEVESKERDSRTTSQTVTSKRETDNKTKVAKEKNTRQTSGPESVWIGNKPDSSEYDIVEVDSKKEDFRTSYQTFTSKQEIDHKTKVVKGKNTRQPSRPESVWIGNKPDSSEYDIVEVDSKKRDSRTTSQTVTSKHETDNKKKVVKIKKTRQPSRPESVWIGNKPDSSEYDIVEVKSQKEDSKTSTQTVTSKQETDNKTKVVKKIKTRQPSRPESVWIGNKPDSSEYDIVEVENKERDSKTTSQTVTSKHETDNKTKVVKEKNHQPGRQESVYIGDTPDSKIYDIVEVVSRKEDSRTSSQTVASKHETDNKTKVVKEKNHQPGRLESVYIGDTPDSKIYDIVEVVSRKEDTRTSSQTVTSKHETDNKTKVVKGKNTPQPSRPESVWIGNKPDSSEYDIVEVENQIEVSKTLSQTVTSKHETDNKTKVVKEKNTRQTDRPDSVWIGNKPDSSEYDIVEVESQKEDSRTSSQTVTNKHETDNKTKVSRRKTTGNSCRPESVWIGDKPDPNKYGQIIDVNKSDTTTSTHASSAKSLYENSRTVKSLQAKHRNVPIVQPHLPHSIIPKSPIQSRPLSYSGQPQPPGSKSPVVLYPGPGPIDLPAPVPPISYPSTTTNPPGPKPPVQPNPNQSPNPGPGHIIHPTPAQPPVPYSPTPMNPPGPKPPVQPNPNQSPNPGPGQIIHPTPAQPPVPYSPTPMNPPGPKPPVQPNPNQPPNPGQIIHPTPAQPPVSYPPTPINAPGPKPPVQNNPNQPPNPGNPGPTIHPTPAQSPVPISKPPTQPQPGSDQLVEPISVWIGKEPDPKDYTIYNLGKDTETDEYDDYESSEEDTSVTEIDKYVKALQLQFTLNVFGVGKNDDCHCTCTTSQPPYFISIPRDKLKGYWDCNA